MIRYLLLWMFTQSVMPSPMALPVRETILQVCERNKVDYQVIKKQIAVESGWRWYIVGIQGEVGLLQVKSITAEEMLGRKVCVFELKDSILNVESGIRYIKFLSKFFESLGYNGRDLKLVTWAAYNEGPGNTIKRHFSGKVCKELCRAFRLYAEQDVLPTKVKIVKAKETRYTKKVLG